MEAGTTYFNNYLVFKLRIFKNRRIITISITKIPPIVVNKASQDDIIDMVYAYILGDILKYLPDLNLTRQQLNKVLNETDTLVTNLANHEPLYWIVRHENFNRNDISRKNDLNVELNPYFI